MRPLKHLGDESITHAVHGLNRMLPLTIIANSLTRHIEAAGDDRIFDGDARPQMIKQFRSRYHPVAARDEMDQ